MARLAARYVAAATFHRNEGAPTLCAATLAASLGQRSIAQHLAAAIVGVAHQLQARRALEFTVSLTCDIVPSCQHAQLSMANGASGRPACVRAFVGSANTAKGAAARVPIAAVCALAVRTGGHFVERDGTSSVTTDHVVRTPPRSPSHAVPSMT